MSTDGGLRALYRKHLPGWQLTAVESATTSPGVPDTEYCSPDGKQGWIENKKTMGYAVRIRPLQASWISRRARLGGRVFIAVRRMAKGGSRSLPADELWLIRGEGVQILLDGGLKAATAEGFLICILTGGPERWVWDRLKLVLRGEDILSGTD